jgi:hypothetical protein
MATYFIGTYFPLFYLQLDAVKHGINQELSFYSVSPSYQFKLHANTGDDP